MHPFLIDLGPVDLPFLGPTRLALPTYGVLVTIAILVGWFWLQRNARRSGIDANAAANAAFWAIVGGIAGGKVGLLLVDLPTFLANPRAIFSMDFLQAAGVVWTAVLGGLAGLLLSARHDRVPLAPLLDAAVVPVPVCQAIGRLGCMAAGCCFGSRCDLPWAVVYHSTEAHARTGVPLGVPLHPAPLYELLWSLAIVLPALLLLRRRPSYVAGELIAAYLCLYGIGRFMVEFARGDEVRGLWLGGTVSTSQLLSLAIAPVALAAWWWLRRRAAAPGAAGRVVHP